MKVAAIIQARMGSTRLPGKVLKKVLGKTLLEYQIERVKQANTINDIIVATTINKKDDEIVLLCEELSINYYRGSEEDVLTRYYEAATQFNVDVVVRLTSDCPVIDPEVIDEVVTYYIDNQNHCDYVSNTIERTFPRGMDTEVFSYYGLKNAYEKAYKVYEREHVTPYFYLSENKNNIKSILYSEDLSKYRMTVDTKEDFELIKILLEEINRKSNRFGFRDFVKLLSDNPEWFLINSHVEQKKIIE